MFELLYRIIHANKENKFTRQDIVDHFGVSHTLATSVINAELCEFDFLSNTARKFECGETRLDPECIWKYYDENNLF